MTLSLVSPAARAMLNGLADGLEAFATADITVYQTNVVLAVFDLALPLTDAIGASLVVLNGPLQSAAAPASGTANRFVIHTGDGEAFLSGTISGLGGGGDIETPSLAITAAEGQYINTFVLTVASAGALGVVGSFTFV